MINEAIRLQHEAIKSAVDIYDVISHFERLKKKGKSYVCKCLLHNENTPSMYIDRRRNIYTCFGGCGSGDAIKFLEQYLKIDYKEAMRWLADFYKIPLDESPGPNYQPIIIASRPKYVPPPRCYIPKDVFNSTLTNHHSNNFIKWLHTLFEPYIVNMVIEKYFIGTSDYYAGKPDYVGTSDRHSGGVVFWQVDNSNNIRYGKIMGYNPTTGKRIKEPDDHINTIHRHYIRDAKQRTKQAPPAWAETYDNQDNKPQALFGQHLLSEYPVAPVALVESEKTAIIASVFFPQFIWLAVGGKVYEKYDKDKKIRVVPDTLRARLKALARRNVVLFPDCGALEDWQELARQCGDIAKFTVNNLLQNVVTEYGLHEKADLCDYLTCEAARRELIDEYKTEIIKRNVITDSEHCGVWLEFADKGLRRIDKQTAYREIIAAGLFELVDDREIHPYYFDAKILAPNQHAVIYPLSKILKAN